MKKLLLSLTLILFLFSCGEDADPDDDDNTTQDTTSTDDSRRAKLSPDVIKGIIESIPNPIEISFLIKETGLKYDPTILNSIDKISDYNTDYRKALNLGVYSTDLGYANIYGQSQDAINFLQGVKEMADGLNIGKFFDYETIKTLASNSDKLDELIQETTTNLERMNEYLQQEDRSDMTVLILTGAWVEAVYLTTSVAQKQSNDQLNIRIAEQKVTLDQLSLLLGHYETSPKMKKLKAELEELDQAYKNIDVKYEKGESKEVIEDGILTIQQTEVPVINMTQEDLDNIYQKISDIRSQIIS
ncbi:MAG: hypothetical protein ACFB0B_17135 [Thermonemataceae bacterium]